MGSFVFCTFLSHLLSNPTTLCRLPTTIRYSRIALEPKHLNLIDRPVDVSSADSDGQLCNDDDDTRLLLKVRGLVKFR
jgi:hypothetical protein